MDTRAVHSVDESKMATDKKPKLRFANCCEQTKPLSIHAYREIFFTWIPACFYKVVANLQKQLGRINISKNINYVFLQKPLVNRSFRKYI